MSQCFRPPWWEISWLRWPFCGPGGKQTIWIRLNFMSLSALGEFRTTNLPRTAVTISSCVGSFVPRFRKKSPVSIAIDWQKLNWFKMLFIPRKSNRKNPSIYFGKWFRRMLRYFQWHFLLAHRHRRTWHFRSVHLHSSRHRHSLPTSAAHLLLLLCYCTRHTCTAAGKNQKTQRLRWGWAKARNWSCRRILPRRWRTRWFELKEKLKYFNNFTNMKSKFWLTITNARSEQRISQSTNTVLKTKIIMSST